MTQKCRGIAHAAALFTMCCEWFRGSSTPPGPPLERLLKGAVSLVHDSVHTQIDIPGKRVSCCLFACMSEYVTKQTFISHRAAVASFDLSTHGSIFLNREPEILASPQDGIAWTEGPVWAARNDWRLLFSDTVEGSLWAWNAVEGLKRLRHYAGGCSEGEEGRAGKASAPSHKA